MFDEAQYWKNRKQGKRGQEDLIPKSKLIKESDVSMGFSPTGQMIAKNRKVRRQKAVDRTFTKKGYQAYERKDGTKSTRKLARRV